MKESFCFPIVAILLLVSFLTSAPVPAQNLHKKKPRQIKAMQKKKQDYAVMQQKIDSHLLQVLTDYKNKKIPAGAYLQPLGIYADKSGNIPVDIAATVSDSLLQSLKMLGAQIIFPSKEYSTIRAQVPPSALETIAGYQAVSFIHTAAQAMNNGSATGNKLTPPVKETSDPLL